MTKDLQFIEGLKHASEFRGAMLERKRIADMIRTQAEAWQRTPTFNYRIELHKLAEAIEKGKNG